MIKVFGTPVAQRKTKKGKNLYLIVLDNGTLVKAITSKQVELLKPTEFVAKSFVADNGQLILMCDE
ncbi:MAG: hypothetical protein JHC31_06845 [Sulfurihydrogenibium sp.]|jgi:hypothetical protein|nr:hypothetical protein [Sulfurihydrogenibium sp.]